MSFLVYRALCKLTGKSYVGCTRKGMPARRREHEVNAGRGYPGKFYDALRTYGAKSFFWEVLQTYPTEKLMFLGERHWIATHHTTTIGYNTTSGGHNGHLNAVDRYRMARGRGNPKRKRM